MWELLRQRNLTAFVCTYSDEHNSAIVGDCDERCAYLTGFSGRVAVAVVTHDDACLWTDSLHYD